MNIERDLELAIERAEAEAARCRAALAAFRGSGGQPTSQPRRRYTGSSDGYHPSLDAYAEVWAAAQRVSDGFTGVDLIAAMRLENANRSEKARIWNAIVKWRDMGVVEWMANEGGGYRVTDAFRPPVEAAVNA